MTAVAVGRIAVVVGRFERLGGMACCFFAFCFECVCLEAIFYLFVFKDW